MSADRSSSSDFLRTASSNSEQSSSEETAVGDDGKVAMIDRLPKDTARPSDLQPAAPLSLSSPLPASIQGPPIQEEAKDHPATPAEAANPGQLKPNDEESRSDEEASEAVSDVVGSTRTAGSSGSSSHQATGVGFPVAAVGKNKRIDVHGEDEAANKQWEQERQAAYEEIQHRDDQRRRRLGQAVESHKLRRRLKRREDGMGEYRREVF